MRRSKKDTEAAILASAKKHFLARGFSKTSVRSIAQDAGITAGALYKHFVSKEAIFSALVAPTYHLMLAFNQKATNEAFAVLQKEGLAAFEAAADRANGKMLTLLYDHVDAVHLMFNCAYGTQYENLRDEIIAGEINDAKRLMQILEAQGYKVHHFNDDQLQLIYRTAVTPFFEIITQGYSYEEAMSYIDIVNDAVNFGWKRLFVTKEI